MGIGFVIRQMLIFDDISGGGWEEDIGLVRLIYKVFNFFTLFTQCSVNIAY